MDREKHRASAGRSGHHLARASPRGQDRLPLRGKNRAERKLDAAIERATGLQASLNEAKRTIRSLTDAIELLQPEADRVPELERRVADLTARETVSGELAETIAKLTSTE